MTHALKIGTLVCLGLALAPLFILGTLTIFTCIINL